MLAAVISAPHLALSRVYRGHDNWYPVVPSFPGFPSYRERSSHALTPTPLRTELYSRVLEPSSVRFWMRTAQPLNITKAPGARANNPRCREPLPSCRCELVGEDQPVVDIATDMSISPSLSETVPDRYAFRAGGTYRLKDFSILPSRTGVRPPYMVDDFCSRRPVFLVNSRRAWALVTATTVVRRTPFPKPLRPRGQQGVSTGILLLSIRLRLFRPESSGPGLTLRGTNLAEEPLRDAFGAREYGILTNVCVTLADIPPLPLRHYAARGCFTLRRNAPYRCIFTSHCFGRSLSPVHLRRKRLAVCYYALFPGWLLLGQYLSWLSFAPLPPNQLSGHLGALSSQILELLKNNSYNQKRLPTDSNTSHKSRAPDELFLALGWHLKEIHVTCAYLEKKRTRLRTYTKSLEESCSQSVETAPQVTSS
ncbi:hypothetical protein Tco_1517184 [Tanacetum coccineum]